MTAVRAAIAVMLTKVAATSRSVTWPFAARPKNLAGCLESFQLPTAVELTLALATYRPEDYAFRFPPIPEVQACQDSMISFFYCYTKSRNLSGTVPLAKCITILVLGCVRN